jgi:hypothetical protein
MSGKEALNVPRRLEPLHEDIRALLVWLVSALFAILALQTVHRLDASA